MAEETYGTKAPVILDLSEVKGATGGQGGSGGSGSAVMSEIMLNPNDTIHFPSIQIGTTGKYAWLVETGVVDENNEGNADSFNYTVYLKKVVSGSADPVIIHNPLVQIVDASTYNPVYVPASSLIYTDTNNTRVMMKQPVSWLDILESGSSVNWQIWVRRIEVSSEEE